MTSFIVNDNAVRREVSESVFEYLLGEIIARETVPSNSAETSTAVEQRLELLGYNVGYRLVTQTFILYFALIYICWSRLLEKISMNHKFIGTDSLDLMKFICKEFWEEVYKKKVFIYVNLF